MVTAIIFAVCFSLGVALVGYVGYYIFQEMAISKRFAQRMLLATTGTDSISVVVKNQDESALVHLVSSFGMLIARSGILSGQTIEQMRGTLEGAGFKGERGLGLFIGAKIMAFFLMPALLCFGLHHFGTSHFWIWVKIGGGAVVGLLLPETLANNIRTKYLQKVELGVPDALDMLVICADAGLALEAGLARVSQELATMNPQLAGELTQTSRELQIGGDMRKAMEALGQRTGLDTLKRLATTLTQSLQYGTPLTAALRTLSKELRDEALVKFEERAGRLPTLMTVPMILFILPCVFLIVAGPAIINVLSTLKTMH
jgi:tight adherence protein C